MHAVVTAEAWFSSPRGAFSVCHWAPANSDPSGGSAVLQYKEDAIRSRVVMAFFFERSNCRVLDLAIVCKTNSHVLLVPLLLWHYSAGISTVATLVVVDNIAAGVGS